MSERLAIVTWFMRTPSRVRAGSHRAGFHVSIHKSDRSALLLARGLAAPVLLGQEIDGAVCVIGRDGEYLAPYLSSDATRIALHCVNGTHLPESSVPQHSHPSTNGLSPQFG